MDEPIKVRSDQRARSGETIRANGDAFVVFEYRGWRGDRPTDPFQAGAATRGVWGIYSLKGCQLPQASCDRLPGGEASAIDVCDAAGKLRMTAFLRAAIVV
jgi:hypothetical protein